MIIINTDKTFRPFGGHYNAEFFMFPSGMEIHTNAKDLEFNYQYCIVCKMRNTGDIFKLLLITDIVRQKNPLAGIDVFIPYLPYARQDRVSIEGDPLSAKIFADILNTQNYRRVMILDHHSDVSRALIKGDKPISTVKFVKSCLPEIENYHVISPDLGAAKKTFDLVRALGLKNPPIQAVKHRDVATGNLSGSEVLCNDLEGKDCYIIDDICSKGGTFMALADKLREKNCGKIYLIVTHYEGSADQSVLSQYIDHIYTTDSIIDEGNDFITVCNIDIEWTRS